MAIVGSGVSGLFAALHLPPRMNAVLLTKEELQHSDSYLAQGGICIRDENDYDSFMEDTLKAGHYENRRESVDIMIRSSREIIRELIEYGVDFAREGEHLAYTREGCHSRPRILFHEDITGEEITSKLLEAVKKLPNITILEHTAMLDLIEEGNCCLGLLASSREKRDFWYPGRSHHPGLRRNRRTVPPLHQLSPPDRRCPGCFPETRDPSGTS